MRSTKADRPRKRQGNFGENEGSGKYRTKSSVYRQVGRRSDDKRQFTR